MGAIIIPAQPKQQLVSEAMAYPTTGSDTDISHKRLITICCMVTFGCYFTVSMRLPVVPLFALDLGMTTAQVGFVNAAFYLTAGLFSLPSGILADRFGRRQVALTGSGILCVGMFMLFFGSSFMQFAGIYLLLGVGMAAFGPTMMSWVAAVTPPTYLGRAYGWYTTAIFCGLGLGPAAGGATGQILGLKPVFLLAACLLVFNFLAVGHFLPYRKHRAPTRAGRGIWRDNITEIALNRPMVGCWVITLGANIVSGMFFTFMPLHAQTKGLVVGEIGLIFFVQALSNAISRIPFGALSDRVHQRKHLALLGALLVAFSIGSFCVATRFFHFLILALGLGVSMAVAFTAIGALVAETALPRFKGLAMGGYNSCIYLGMMTGSFGLGPVIERSGFAEGFITTGLMYLPFILIFVWFMSGYRQQEAEKVEGTPDR